MFLNKKNVAVVAGVTSGLAVVSTSANAALDPGVSTGFTAVLTDFTSLLALAYPLMIAIVTALVIFGLVKMFIRKSAT